MLQQEKVEVASLPAVAFGISNIKSVINLLAMPIDTLH
jgi:hypothetical protein